MAVDTSTEDKKDIGNPETPKKQILRKDIYFCIRFVKPEEAFDEAILRAIDSARKFLDINRATDHSQAENLKKQILQDLTNLPLNTTNRGILVAYNQAVCDRKNRKTITAKRGGISFPIRPGFTTDISNLFIPGIGSYGDKDEKSILSILRCVIGNDRDALENQKKLFLKIAECEKTGKAIDIQDLYEINSNLKCLKEQEIQSLQNKLQQVIYLITTLEITRRKKFDLEENNNSCCREIMLDAWCKVSRLLQEGFLTLDDVFSSDAPYGLPTGKNVARQSESLCKKYWNIYCKHMESFYPDEVEKAKKLGLVAILSQEGCHSLYTSATTAAKESPGKVYETPAKENCPYIASDYSPARRLFF